MTELYVLHSDASLHAVKRKLGLKNLLDSKRDLNFWFWNSEGRKGGRINEGIHVEEKKEEEEAEEEEEKVLKMETSSLRTLGILLLLFWHQQHGCKKWWRAAGFNLISTPNPRERRKYVRLHLAERLSEPPSYTEMPSHIRVGRLIKSR